MDVSLRKKSVGLAMISSNINASDGSASPTTPMPRVPRPVNNRYVDMWTQAEKSFRDKTNGQRLGSYDVKSKDSILKRYKQVYESDDSSKKASGFQSEALQQVLNGIELVASFAAQAVSGIFSPASMCFNALECLINIPRQIKKVYDALAALFTEIARFLVKFKIYKRIEDGSDLGEEFLTNTTELLLCFVDVCGTAVKFIHGGRWDHFKTFSSIVLLQDNQMLDALNNFKEKCEASDSLANTVMLEHVMSSEVDVKQIKSMAHTMDAKMGYLVARDNDEKTRIVNQDQLKSIAQNLFSIPPKEDLLFCAPPFQLLKYLGRSTSERKVPTMVG